MSILDGEDLVIEDFINESEQAATRSEDAGRVPKLEADGRVHKSFLSSVVDVQVFTASGTWTKPDTGQVALIRVWGAGGSGAKENSAINTDGQLGGGGGGGYSERLMLLSELPSTVAASPGAGGAAVIDPDHGTGENGEDSTFGSYVKAYGGGGGHQTGNGGGGGGLYGAGETNGTGDPYESADATAYNDPVSIFKNAGGPGGSAATNGGAQDGHKSIFGGGGGGGRNAGSGGDAGSGGESLHSGNGGAAGIGTADAEDGEAPAGGGGAANNGNSGAGADGRIEVIVM